MLLLMYDIIYNIRLFKNKQENTQLNKCRHHNYTNNTKINLLKIVKYSKHYLQNKVYTNLYI